MRISPYFRLLFFAILVTFVPIVGGKGGGGKGKGASGSSSTSSSSSSGGEGINPIITSSGSGTSTKRPPKVCVDAATNLVVKCPRKPLSKGASIAIGVIFGVISLVVLALLIYSVIVKRRRRLNKGAQETRSIDSEQGPSVPVTLMKEDYSSNIKHPQSPV